MSSVVPDHSDRGVTLDVTVNGSGFDQGSVARLERQGTPAAGITTNSTTYVTSRKLVANVTISATADTGKYDVAVITLLGRKGVGIEKFTVTYVMDELGIIGGTWSRAHAINDLGQVVGASCTADCLSTAFYWSEATGQVALGGLTGYTRSSASAINNRGQIFGEVRCDPTDSACNKVFKQALVRWDKVGSNWIITPVAGCMVVNIVSDQSSKFLINDNEQCVARKPAGGLAVQRLSGGAVASEEMLPLVYPNASSQAYAINNLPMVAGYATNGRLEPVVWYRDATGAWRVLHLGLPGTDDWGRATDLSEPDGAGRVWVSGFTQDIDDGTGPLRPVRWTLEADGLGGWQASAPEVLVGGTSGAPCSRGGVAIALNLGGNTVGNFGSCAGDGLPVLWPLGGPVDKLPGIGGDAGSGRAADINNGGWIVGAVWDNTNKCDRAAIWRQR